MILFQLEAANLALEQNKDGELIEIGGIRVYRSSNMEKNRFVWIDGMTVCSLTTTCNAKMQRRLSLHLASSKIKRSANALSAKKCSAAQSGSSLSLF